MWVFEMFQIGLGMWFPMETGEEATCRERYDWYVENRPDLVKQLNLRNAETDPGPPPPPDLTPDDEPATE